MSEETTVDAGSETSGETAAVDTAQTDTTATDTSASETAQATTDAGADAGGAAEPKQGDPCTCPNGAPGTLQPVGDENGKLICIMTTPDGPTGV